MDKFFRLEVDSKYSATKTSVDEEIDDEREIYLILPNGTMIIKNPRVTKFVERYVRRNNEEPVNKFASNYIVREYTKPWDSDPECIEYAEEIKRKAVGEHVESYSDCDTTKKENLLEIKLKDTESVPEVWYRGKRVDELPNGLVDAYMHWHTCEADKPTELMTRLEYIEGTDVDAKRVKVCIDEEGERGSFNLLKDEIDD